ncbi:MAG: TolC family protein [Thermodesulfobacteriota bacterium]
MTSLLAAACAAAAIAAEAPPLPIEAAVAQALAHAPQRRAVAERSEAARGALAQAGRLPNPLLELRGEGIDGSDPWGRDGALDFFALLSVPIELGGKRAARQAVAAAELDGARAQMASTERELTLQTARTYLLALRGRELAEVLQENRTGLGSLVDAMRLRVARGYAPEADLMRFLAEVEQLDVRITQARIELDRASAALAALVGMTGRVAADVLVEPPLPEPPSGDVDDLVARALAQHPQIAAAEARRTAARHALELEKARRIPDPLLTGGYERTSGLDTGVAGIVVPLPVFDTNRGNVERAAAEERAATADLDALRLQLAAELRSLVLGARDLVQRARGVEQRLVGPAMTVRQAARSAFREGGANILQLVDAERLYTEARKQALDLRLEAIVRSYEAQVAVAGRLES